jgi:hypothetical protein
VPEPIVGADAAEGDEGTYGDYGRADADASWGCPGAPTGAL